MKRWLNILTGLALTFIIIVGIWKSKPETLKNQPFLLDGSNGVSIRQFFNKSPCSERNRVSKFVVENVFNNSHIEYDNECNNNNKNDNDIFFLCFIFLVFASTI